MTYLVTHPDFEPFLTNWFDYNTLYVDGVIIYNIIKYTYTTDGINWKDIKQDHL